MRNISSFLGCLFVLMAFSGCGGQTAEGQSEGKGDQVAGGGAIAASPAANKGPVAVPDEFAVKLVTTKGDIIIDVKKAWAPKGAERFHELVRNGYFTDVAFFRVIDGFMAQVGIHGDPAVNKEWRTKKIADDPVVESNLRGTVSFATSGKNSRTTQFFISFSDNAKLDGMGFAPFGKVRDMTVVDKLHAGYGEGAPKGMGPSQRRLQTEGNAYLKTEFPLLDYIKSAEIL